MRHLFVFITVVIISISIYPDNGGGQGWINAEVYFCVDSGFVSQSYTFTAQSTVWRYKAPPVDSFEITTSYNSGTFSPSSTQYGASSMGFNFQPAGGELSVIPNFGVGLYKVTSSITNKYFYLDYRDQRVANDYVNLYNHDSSSSYIDIWFKYFSSDNKFHYSGFGIPDINSRAIGNGELLNIWDLKGITTIRETSSLPNYWSNC